MGVKGSCRSANRGGWLFFMPVLHIASGLPSCLPSSSLVVNFQPIGANFRQKVAKVNIYLLALVFSRDFWRPKRVKFKIYLSFEGAGASVVALSLGRWWCPPSAGGALLLPLFGCVPSLCPSFVPFLLCLPCRLRIWLYFAF